MSTAVETRKLVAHEKLLIDVIKRQAGSLKKAILEGTMNSVEAGATEIDINFIVEKSTPEQLQEKNPSPALLSIYDDGIGIQTKEELIKHFETFGQPHEANENVIWKQFRMGRGQMFAFGKNTWRTSTFKMLVDVDNMELDYHLEDGLKPINGCKIDIELYNNPLDNNTIWSVKSLKEEVKEQVRFVTIPVKFNDEIVSVAPNTLNWDYEDKHAYYKFNDTSSLKIYNLGVFVMAKSIREAGVGGVIVSKTMLKVNFARNDVDSTCPTFQAINKVVMANKIKKASKSYKSLSSDERYNMLCGLRDAEELAYKYEGRRMFPLSNGKWISWKMLMKDGRKWCFAPMGNMVADKAMQSNKALCFDKEMLDELGYDGEVDKFFDWLWSDLLDNNYYPDEHRQKELDVLRNNFILFDGNEYVSDDNNYQTVKDAFNESYSYIPYSQLKKVEKRFVDTMYYLGCWEDRQIKIGISDVADAWTDGASYIAFDRKWLDNISLTSVSGLLKLFTAGCHELAHDNNSAGTHVHGPEFYEKYYEITQKNHYHNPLYYIHKFKDSMARAKANERREKEEKKRKEQQKELGLCVE